MFTNPRVNLFPLFEKCIQHYRPPIQALLLSKPYDPYDQPESVTRSIAVQLLLVSRAAEIGVRLVNESCNYDPLFILDTIAGMDLYRDLLLRLFERYRYLFHLTLDVEGMFSTPWECMIHAQNVEVEVYRASECEATLRRALIDQICKRASQTDEEPGQVCVHTFTFTFRELQKAWQSYLISWRWVMMSRQTAIGMMSNRLLYLHNFHNIHNIHM